MIYIELSKAQIDSIFEAATNQGDYVLGLYRIPHPDFDNVLHVGFPRVSPATSEYIFKLAQSFDRIHHPGVYAGGAWFNSGFGVDNSVPDWCVIPSNEVEYKSSKPTGEDAHLEAAYEDSQNGGV